VIGCSLPCENALVRTSPLIGQKAWFGPRRLGWGLAPVSPEGWVVAATGTLLGVVASRRGTRRRATRLSVSAALLLIVVLKGTAPGGPLARRAFEEARRAGAAVTA
jgi:hypothetical protein